MGIKKRGWETGLAKRAALFPKYKSWECPAGLVDLGNSAVIICGRIRVKKGEVVSEGLLWEGVTKGL